MPRIDIVKSFTSHFLFADRTETDEISWSDAFSMQLTLNILSNNIATFDRKRLKIHFSMINSFIKAKIRAGKAGKMFQKGGDPMKKKFSNLLAILSVLLLLSGCAVFVGEGGHYHRGYWRRHSSLQQSDLPSNHEMTAFKSGETQDHHDPRR